MTSSSHDPLTDEQVIHGLDDRGQSGTRTARIQFNGDGEIVEASNQGLMVAQAYEKPSNYLKPKMEQLEQENGRLIAEAEKLPEGSPERKTILDKMDKLEEQAKKLKADGDQADAAHEAEASRIAGIGYSSLKEEFEIQQEAAQDRANAERERRKQQHIY